jgi:hypothetical protein
VLLKDKCHHIDRHHDCALWDEGSSSGMVLQIAHLVVSCCTNVLMLHQFALKLGNSKHFFFALLDLLLNCFEILDFLIEVVLWWRVHGLPFLSSCFKKKCFFILELIYGNKNITSRCKFLWHDEETLLS